MKRALFQEGREGGKVQCGLCAHRCLIASGHRGICAVRENRDGELVTLVYDRVIAQNVDPIEKKPLFQFLPGSLSFKSRTNVLQSATSPTLTAWIHILTPPEQRAAFFSGLYIPNLSRKSPCSFPLNIRVGR